MQQRVVRVFTSMRLNAADRSGFQAESRGMDGVAAEVAQEIRVFLYRRTK
jgi:hypothetical protein